MKASILFFLFTAIRIVVLFTVAMLGTFATEAIEATGFFGDYVNERGYNEWGMRHVWWMVMMVLLTILALIRTGYDIYFDGKRTFGWQ